MGSLFTVVNPPLSQLAGSDRTLGLVLPGRNAKADDTLTVRQVEIPGNLRKKVLEAERLCPRRALRIEG